MGILNVTPDSFSDGGRHAECAAALAQAAQLESDGAAWIDVGGESTRPGSAPVPADEELRRVLPVVTALAARGGAPLSIDTTKAVVAAATLAAGATMINDVSAGSDPDMFSVVASHDAALVLMHMQGEPRTMQAAPRYANVVDEVSAHLETRLATAVNAGVRAERILLDPGIGFGKTIGHNLALLRALPLIRSRLGRPLLIGISRKRFLGTLASITDPAGRDGVGHVVQALIAPWCALIRVHDVAGARQALEEAAG
jgi:dihydropteroate synthase